MAERADRLQISGRHWRMLREILAARIDSAASMVEPDQLVSGFCSDDLHDRQRLISELEQAFSIQFDASILETVQTVGELAERIAAHRSHDDSGRRAYIIVYRNKAGNIVEEHVRANSHEAAIEFLRTSGLDQVLSVSREDDENRDFRGGHGRMKNALLTILLALLAAGGIVFYFWMRRH